jgi:hypothetical protein
MLLFHSESTVLSLSLFCGDERCTVLNAIAIHFRFPHLLLRQILVNYKTA